MLMHVGFLFPYFIYFFIFCHRTVNRRFLKVMASRKVKKSEYKSAT